MPVALRLYLPDAWAADMVRRKKIGVSQAAAFRAKGEMALTELDGATSAGARFGRVLADPGNAGAAEFLWTLTEGGFLGP